jgi:hypothetical protein
MQLQPRFPAAASQRAGLRTIKRSLIVGPVRAEGPRVTREYREGDEEVTTPASSSSSGPIYVDDAQRVGASLRVCHGAGA